jgi:hypothetical protein
MTSILKRPYRQVGTPGERVIGILLFGLFIFLFLFLFRPFGLADYKTLQLFLITLGFGAVTTFMLFIFKFLLEDTLISRKKWTFGKNLLWDILIASSIGIANYIYLTIIFHQAFFLKYMIFSIWTAWLVGSIPVTISYIVTFNKIYRNKLHEVSIETRDLVWEDEVVIRAGNQKNAARLNPRKIVYISSNDNYVTIVSINNESLSKTTIRGTLKSVEEELKKNESFLRCHKCYIVNLEFAERVTGHNQNMKIKFSFPGMEIPVSRSNAKEVSARIRKQ